MNVIFKNNYVHYRVNWWGASGGIKIDDLESHLQGHFQGQMSLKHHNYPHRLLFKLSDISRMAKYTINDVDNARGTSWAS